MIRGFLFDLDGLLADTEGISWQIYQKMLEPFGREMSKTHYAQNYSGKTEAANITRIIEEYQLPYSFDEAWNAEKEIEADLIEQGAALKPGAREILVSLKSRGSKVALASSSRKERARKILERHGIWDLFDTYVLAEDITRPKPDGEVFKKAADSLQLEPPECLVLEDSEAGIRAAGNAGIPVLCIPDLKIPQPQILKQCTAVCPDLFEAENYIVKTIFKS